MGNILYLFHHFHHKNGVDSIHHCGSEHCQDKDNLDYTIRHCACGKHAIDRESAVGHSINSQLKKFEIKAKFLEKCPEGGWHIESGIIND